MNSEAMKQALETAEGIANADWRKWEESASPEEFVRWAKSRAAHMATALRTAIEQAEKSNIKQVIHLYDKPPAAPVQEPVAWMGTDIEGNPNKFRLNPFNGGVELYKKPQSVKVWHAEGYDALMQELELWKAAAQRQWVGLTGEERKKLWRDVVKWGDPSHDDVDLMEAIEAKLKEKNT